MIFCMRMIAGSLLICILALGGCAGKNEDSGQGPESNTPAESSARSAAAGPGGDLAPPNIKEKRLSRAMQGLSYESGLVQVDQTALAQRDDLGDNRSAEKLFDLGNKMLFEVNDRVRAISAFTRAVILASDVPRHYVGLGQALLAKGKSSEALAAFHTALSLDDRYLDARLHLARALQMTGDNAASISAWERVLDLDPNHGTAHKNLAVLFYYTNNYPRAWDHVHQAESVGYEIPAQFRPLLEKQMGEPLR